MGVGHFRGGEATLGEWRDASQGASRFDRQASNSPTGDMLGLRCAYSSSLRPPFSPTRQAELVHAIKRYLVHNAQRTRPIGALPQPIASYPPSHLCTHPNEEHISSPSPRAAKTKRRGEQLAQMPLALVAIPSPRESSSALTNDRARPSLLAAAPSCLLRLLPGTHPSHLFFLGTRLVLAPLPTTRERAESDPEPSRARGGGVASTPQPQASFEVGGIKRLRRRPFAHRASGGVGALAVTPPGTCPRIKYPRAGTSRPSVIPPLALSSWSSENSRFGVSCQALPRNPPLSLFPPSSSLPYR